MSAPATFEAKFEFEHGVVLDARGGLTHAQAEILWSAIQAVLSPTRLVPEEFKYAGMDDVTAYRFGRRMKVGDFMMEAHERGEACGYDHCQDERCRSAASIK